MSTGEAPRDPDDVVDWLVDVPRPWATPDLFGHMGVLDGLLAVHRSGRLPHALLFSGPRGIGKATLAFHLCRRLLGEAESGRPPADPAVVDRIRRQIMAGAAPDLVHLRPEWNPATRRFRDEIGVDAVRSLGHGLRLTIGEGGWRFVVVDRADDLNRNAANALLKMLEEPPPRTLFLLLSDNADRVLPTIRSRCRLVRVAPLGEEDLAAALEARSIAPSPSAIAVARGSVRAAIGETRRPTAGLRAALDVRIALGRADAAAGAGDTPLPAGTDFGTAVDVLSRLLHDRIRDPAATAAARSGATAAWSRVASLAADVDTYNLDREQALLDIAEAIRDAMPLSGRLRRPGNGP